MWILKNVGKENVKNLQPTSRVYIFVPRCVQLIFTVAVIKYKLENIWRQK
jgi:hypothetical protein